MWECGGGGVCSPVARRDGTEGVVFANGTQKMVKLSGESVVRFFNGDVKHTLADGSVCARGLVCACVHVCDGVMV